MKLPSLVRPLVSAVSAFFDWLFYAGPSQPTPCQQQQVAHTSAASFTDTIYAISANLPATYDAAGYGNVAVVFTVVDRVQDFPTYGSKREVAKFTPIRGAVEKVKSAPDYGGGDMVMADMPLDPGQIILKAADASQNHYSMKITYPDGQIDYLDVIVAAWGLTPAKAAAFMLRTATLEFNKAPVIVPAP